MCSGDYVFPFQFPIGSSVYGFINTSLTALASSLMRMRERNSICLFFYCYGCAIIYNLDF